MGREKGPAAGRKWWGDGFTLVELLVVVAILTILASILFPVLARAREQAHRAACLAQVRQIGQAHRLYLQDWDEQLPPWKLPGPLQMGAHRYWPEFLQPYLRSDTVLRDPAGWKRSRSATTPLLAEYALLTWEQRCPPHDPALPCMRWPGPPLSLAAVVRPAETITLIDGWTTPGRTEADTRRHGGGSHVSFVDGHARWLSHRELWRVEEDREENFWLHYGSAHR